jgi:predicted alpha/beta superfamily hydrolase
MKCHSLLETTLAVSALALSTLYLAPHADAGEPLILGERLQLRSQSMGEMRTYQVHRPAGYDLSNARYPVLVVLDGNEHFEHVSTTVDFLASAAKVPAMIVVGVPNKDRFRDLSSYRTPPGASPLLDFITAELIPKIDRDYRTRPYRILIGWSSAGLFAIHSMIQAPEAFRGYVVVAPAFGDDRALPQAVAAFLDSHKEPFLNAELFMATDDGTGANLSGAWELASYLQQRASRVRDLRFTFRRYLDESHGSVPLRSMSDGLLHIFEGWDLGDPFSLYEQGGLAAIEKHFGALSARLGFPVPVPEDALFSTFGQLEYRKRYPEAEQVISRAIELYPENTTALYYAGRLRMETGNTAAAIETLKKSLLLSPNDRLARSLLNDMKVDPNGLVAEVRLSAKDLAKYVGGYGDSAVVLAIERRGDKLFSKTVDREYELDALSGTKFHYSENNVYSDGGVVTFRTDDRGRVTGLVFQKDGAELAKLK